MRQFFKRFGLRLIEVLVPGDHVFLATNPLLSHIVIRSLVESGIENRGIIARWVMTVRGGDRLKTAHEEFSQVSVTPRSMAEPWLSLRKPLEGRVQDNLRKWRTGGLRGISESKPFGDVIESHPTRPAERNLAPRPSLKPQFFLRKPVPPCHPPCKRHTHPLTSGPVHINCPAWLPCALNFNAMLARLDFVVRVYPIYNKVGMFVMKPIFDECMCASWTLTLLTIWPGPRPQLRGLCLFPRLVEMP